MQTVAKRTTGEGGGRRGAAAHRVLLILQSSTLGGMERQCIDLAGELARRGSVVTAVVPEEAALDPVADSLRRSGAAVERITTDARTGRLAQVSGIARLTRTARRFAPDVVHLHFGGATGGLAAAAAARLSTKAAVVVTEHDVPQARPGLAQRANRFLLDRAVHVVVTVSRHNAQLRLQRLGAPACKLAVVLNGATVPAVSASVTAAHRGQVRRDLGIPSRVMVVGSVVRLAPGKGLDTLLKAFAIVVQNRESHLLLVGGGPLEPEVRALARDLGLEDRVTLTGHQADPGRFVDAMDVFVLAVPVGSGSMALLEAMARGKAPVITFGDGEEAVVSGQTGVWAPPNDPTALASAVVRLYADPEARDRLGRAAAAHVQRHYSIERLVNDLGDVYAAARRGQIPTGLRVTDPADRQPGARGASASVP